MQGHVARKRGRYYAVIYEGLDPVTGKERRTWHPAGTDGADAEVLAARLAATRRAQRRGSLAHLRRLAHRPVAAKKLTLSVSAYRGYVLKVRRHILPTLGHRRLRRLRRQGLEHSTPRCCSRPTNGPDSPKTVSQSGSVELKLMRSSSIRRGLGTTLNPARSEWL